MIQVSLMLSLLGLSVAVLLCAYRALKGPTVANRVVALDAVIVVLMAFLLVGSIAAHTEEYLAYAIVMAVLSYISTVAFAKYVERGVVIERLERDTD